jgi:hypothetical protein
MKKLFICLSVISLFLIGCSKTNEVAESKNAPPNAGGSRGNCDTIYMRYNADVKPILQANCYSCHGNGMAESGITLDAYANVKRLADAGTLLGVITHASGYPHMPYQKPKLSDCDINKIRDWINWHALNN